LLEEEAKALWTRAGDEKHAAVDTLDPGGHLEHMHAIERGERPERGDAAGFEADARALEAEAVELKTHLNEISEAA
jgi:hypothetical protein